jgi:hypothetical protein
MATANPMRAHSLLCGAVEPHGRRGHQAELDDLAGQCGVEQSVRGGAGAVAGWGQQVVSAGDRLGRQAGEGQSDRIRGSLRAAEVDHEPRS